MIAAAPGRVNLIGEHIDYNDGFVMPMAIDRYVVIAASPASDPSRRRARLHSLHADQTVEIELGVADRPSTDSWGRYLEGVVSGFAARGVELPPFDAVIASNVPQGGGLSSSAALEVAAATMLEGLTGHRLTPLEKVILCQTAEHQFAGVPCGIMDQYSSVFGRPDQFMWIDCRDQSCQMVDFGTDDDFGSVSVLITNSNVQHELVGGEYAQRRGQCDRALQIIGRESWRDVSLDDIQRGGDSLDDVHRRRARHVVSEIRRTQDAAEAFLKNDFGRAGSLMNASHDSLRDDFEVSCPELDALVEIALQIGPSGGVLGSRMTGGGFGGSTVTLVRDDKIEQVIQTISEQYRLRTGLRCDCFASRPSMGAHQITV